MPRVAPELAFEFWPQLDLRLGPKVYTVPPLSLGRFLAIMDAAPADLEHSALLAGAAALRSVNADEKEVPRLVMRALAQVPPASLWPLVSAVVPRLERGDWEDHGGLLEALELAVFFASVHDWDLIKDELGTHEDHEIPQKRTVIGAMALFSQASGRPIEELFAMRLEGFFYYKRGYREAHENEQAASDVEPGTMGAAGIKDTQRAAGIWNEIEKAEADGS